MRKVFLQNDLTAVLKENLCRVSLRRANAGLMLVQRVQRWANIKAALSQRLAFAVLCILQVNTVMFSRGSVLFNPLPARWADNNIFYRKNSYLAVKEIDNIL